MSKKNNTSELNWEEELELILAKDEQVKIHASKSLNYFFENHEISNNNFYHNIFMSAQQYTQNLFKKHAILAYMASFLLLTTLIGVTAEATAPQEYKPTNVIQNLFIANKQAEKEPYTALKPDEGNEVVISDYCDLAIKYPKKINNISISVQENLSTPENEDITIYTDVKPEDTANYKYSTGSQNFFSVNCADKIDPFFELSSDYSISKEKLREETGWFITQGDISDIKFEETLNETILIQFKFNNRYYQINYTPETENQKSKDVILFGNNIQLQFNSLVKNQASLEIPKKEL